MLVNSCVLYCSFMYKVMVQWNHYLVWPSKCNFVFTLVLSCYCPLSAHGLFKIMLTCLSLHACILFYSLTYISTAYVIHMIIIQNAINVAHHCVFLLPKAFVLWENINEYCVLLKQLQSQTISNRNLE